MERLSAFGAFPALRMRRMRATPLLRALVRETELSVHHLVLPLFVRPGSGVVQPIGALPGHAQLSPDMAEKQATEAAELGIPAVILFGIPSTKDEIGSESYLEDGIVQQAIRRIKRALADRLVVIADVCFCEYTSHGHCGVLTDRTGRMDVDNDATLQLLGRQAISFADAGADVVAPSGMMDGMVQVIRTALDEAGFNHVPILSYAAKYASAFYGPFREAAESAPQFGDRRSYQMDPANADEAVREVALDLQEGADVVMVKPALAYLDVIRRVKEAFGVPVAAYNVSGEYAMVKAAAQQGWIDERSAVLEILTSIRRAGADFILTYHALDVARWLA